MMFEKSFEILAVNCSQTQRDSFADLHPDEHHPGRTRERRFGQHRLYSFGNSWSVERLPTRPFVQPKKNNGLSGGIKRYFQPITASIDNLIIQGATVAKLDPSKIWLVNVHQYRVLAKADTQGDPVPEGAHRDGADLILMVCVGRQNVTGGVSRIFDDNMNELIEYELKPGEGVLVNDAITYHDASKIAPTDTSAIGHRDMYVIGYNDWSRGKYGAEFEIQHTGSAADPALISPP